MQKRSVENLGLAGDRLRIRNAKVGAASRSPQISVMILPIRECSEEDAT